MALIFLGLLISFTTSSFDSQSQIAVTSWPMISGPNSPDLNLPDYQVWGNAEAATEAKITS